MLHTALHCTKDHAAFCWQKGNVVPVLSGEGAQQHIFMMCGHCCYEWVLNAASTQPIQVRTGPACFAALPALQAHAQTMLGNMRPEELAQYQVRKLCMWVGVRGAVMPV